MSILSAVKKLIKGERILTIRQSADAWEKQFQKGKWDFLINDPLNQGHVAIIGLLCQLLSRGREIKVLDVGCGNGSVARMITETCQNCRYYGLDISQNALDTLKKDVKNAVLYCADAHHPPPFKEKFDVIIFCEVLLYLEFEKVLERYRQFLTDDGVMILSLYDTLRTKLIWRKIDKFFVYLVEYRVSNKKKGIVWNIKMGRFRT